MPHLMLLVGLPGSGKTTLAAELLHQQTGACLISTDRIRQQLFGNEAIQGPWLKVWTEVGHQFQRAANQIETGQAEVAIYDATNAVRKQRRQAIALARTRGFSVITVIWLDTPLEVCLDRNRRRDRQVPEAVILQMHRCLIGAPPSLTEGLEGLVRLGPIQK